MNIEESIEYLKLKIKKENLTIQGMFGDIYEEIRKDNTAIETLLTAYEKEKELLELASNMLDNIDYDQIPIEIGELKSELKKETEKNKKAIDFINDKNNYFEDGENWQNVLKIKHILEE